MKKLLGLLNSNTTNLPPGRNTLKISESPFSSAPESGHACLDV